MLVDSGTCAVDSFIPGICLNACGNIDRFRATAVIKDTLNEVSSPFFYKTSNNQRLANAGEDFLFAHLVNKRFGGL